MVIPFHFLNNQLIFQHIRLLEPHYIIKLAVSELKEPMSNYGSGKFRLHSPNTSYMVAIVGDKRYEARLEVQKAAALCEVS